MSWQTVLFHLGWLYLGRLSRAWPSPGKIAGDIRGTYANANAGFLFVHQDYEDVDIYDPANYVWTEGNTTYVYVPTKNLPLLEPLRWVGLSALADALNEPLKEIVERAYDRSYGRAD